MVYAITASIDMMKLIHSHGASWSHAATKLAVSRGYLVLATAFSCGMELCKGEDYITDILNTRDRNVIDLMISQGYTPSSALLIKILAKKDHSLALHLIKHDYVQFSYHCFKYIDNVKDLKMWLKNGLNFQYHGRNVVKQAIRNGYFDIIKYLTENNYQFTKDDALSSIYGKSDKVFEHLFKLFDTEFSTCKVPLNIMYEHYASHKIIWHDRYQALVQRGSIDFSKVLNLCYIENGVMSSPSEDKCPICMADLVGEYVEFICKHRMHKSCFYDFLANSSTYDCSICRSPIFI